MQHEKELWPPKVWASSYMLLHSWAKEQYFGVGVELIRRKLYILYIRMLTTLFFVSFFVNVTTCEEDV